MVEALLHPPSYREGVHGVHGKHLVPGRVAEAVVDGLEVDDVDHQRDEVGPEIFRLGKALLGKFDEPAPVAQARAEALHSAECQNTYLDADKSVAQAMIVAMQPPTALSGERHG